MAALANDIEAPSPPCNSNELFAAFIAQGRGASSAAEDRLEIPPVDEGPSYQMEVEDTDHELEQLPPAARALDPLPNRDAELPEPRSGGETASDIFCRLVFSYRGNKPLDSAKLQNRANTLFQIKDQILHKMEDLDPGRGWLSGGAKFLRTRQETEFSPGKLQKILSSLESQGNDSPYFHSFLQNKNKEREGFWGGR